MMLLLLLLRSVRLGWIVQIESTYIIVGVYFAVVGILALSGHANEQFVVFTADRSVQRLLRITYPCRSLFSWRLFLMLLLSRYCRTAAEYATTGAKFFALARVQRLRHWRRSCEKYALASCLLLLLLLLLIVVS